MVQTYLSQECGVIVAGSMWMAVDVLVKAHILSMCMETIYPAKSVWVLAPSNICNMLPYIICGSYSYMCGCVYGMCGSAFQNASCMECVAPRLFQWGVCYIFQWATLFIHFHG